MKSWIWSKIEQRLPRIVDSTQVNHAVVGHDKPWYFSERRFLVFGKKGPWELVIKPSHVGFSAMIFSSLIFALGYFSVQTINTAFIVANQEFISPADASLIATNKPSIEPEEIDSDSFIAKSKPSFGPLKKELSLNHYLFSMKIKDLEKFTNLEKTSKNIDKWHDQPLEAVNDDFELSRTLAETMKLRIQLLSSFDIKKSKLESQEIQIVFNVPVQKNNIFIEEDNPISNDSYKLKNPVDIALNEETAFFPSGSSLLKTDKSENTSTTLEDEKLKTIARNVLPQNDEPILIDDKVRGARFLKSIDREIKVIETVFEKLGIKLTVPETGKIKLANLNWPMQPNSMDYLEYMRKQFIKLDVYRDALASLPLHSPMKYYYISSKYGKRKHPVTKKWAMHHGIDLAGTWQEKVRATADGTVVSSGWEGSFGRVVRVQHRFGIQTIYAHLASLNVKKGDYITSGDIIGSMGSSGRSDGAHLHYEIRVDNVSKNPKQFFDVGQSLLSPSSLRLSAF